MAKYAIRNTCPTGKCASRKGTYGVTDASGGTCCCGGGCDFTCCLVKNFFCGAGQGVFEMVSLGLEFVVTSTARSRRREFFGLGVGAGNRYKELDYVYRVTKNPVTCAVSFACVSFKYKEYVKYDSGIPDDVVANLTNCSQSGGFTPWYFINSTRPPLIVYFEDSADEDVPFEYETMCSHVANLTYNNQAGTPINVGQRTYSFTQTCKSVNVSISNPDWVVEWSPGSFVFGGTSFTSSDSAVVTKDCDGNSIPSDPDGGSSGGEGGLVLPDGVGSIDGDVTSGSFF